VQNKNCIPESSHDGAHTDRVKRIALFIGKIENADLKVLEKAAELHDVARDLSNHAIEGAKMAREILRSERYDEDFIERVAHCIESHAFSSGIKPQTLEAKILSDADKLDAMGAVGVARTFLFSGERGRTIEDTIAHFDEKLLKLYNLLYTDTAKRLAKRRHEFMVEFYRRIKEELDLKDAEARFDISN
jgi:uncharacterized protein